MCDRSGHRVLPHTADVALEAWAPTRTECMAEAVRALAESFSEPIDPPPSTSLAFTLPPEPDDDLLVRLLDEVIYYFEVHAQLAVDAEIEETEEGGLSVRFAAVPVNQVDITGASPKAVSLHELECRFRAGSWKCHVTVDV